MLSDSLGAVGGHVADADAKLLGHGDVDGIKAGAAHEDELDAKARKNLERHSVANVGVDESADRVIALGEDGGTPGQVGLRELDLDLGILVHNLGEGIPVVVPGSVEQNLHALAPFRYVGFLMRVHGLTKSRRMRAENVQLLGIRAKMAADRPYIPPKLLPRLAK